MYQQKTFQLSRQTTEFDVTECARPDRQPLETSLPQLGMCVSVDSVRARVGVCLLWKLHAYEPGVNFTCAVHLLGLMPGALLPAAPIRRQK
ncbi:hypothetical protein BS78_01G345100 [Paspalum vaginatum]|nr:hypothetical protein BS78_01G345100 [Paspalum vaginatum]